MDNKSNQKNLTDEMRIDCEKSVGKITDFTYKKVKQKEKIYWKKAPMNMWWE